TWIVRGRAALLQRPRSIEWPTQSSRRFGWLGTGIPYRRGESMAFTATKDTVLPSTVIGSWPRPSWFTESMWGRPLDTAMMDQKYREQFQDALAVVVSEQQRAGLDILTNGDYFLDADFAGRSWHHYPLQRWLGLEHDELQPADT